MEDIPRAVLSEHFQEKMKGRRLVSAVFVTYQFDPGFFEQEVLPVFLDIPLSHAAAIRLLQLEDALRDLKGRIAVYYDAEGLVSGDAGSSKLDIGRIPIRHKTGVFHPKNIFLLVESEEPDEDGLHAKALIVASLSANMTRSGWWENVEVCHTEEIFAGEKTRLKEDLESFLESLRRKFPAERNQPALKEILDFIKDVRPRATKSSFGQLQTHFYGGGDSVADFLRKTIGKGMQGCYLEIISPFFDDAKECGPLRDLIERFEPKEVRVFLPKSATGEALCRRELYEAVRALPDVKWGRFSRDITRMGKADDAGDRFVHAKVYRLFTLNPKREICFVGSPNLTTAAHQAGGNVETGFLVDLESPPRRPEFWLTADEKRPGGFQVRTEDEVSASSPATFLNLRYHWDKKSAEAYWDAAENSPDLPIEARGVKIGVIPSLLPKTWTRLGADLANGVENALTETSLFSIPQEGGKSSLFLVQEEGMARKPSLLMKLSAADILKYWSLLTPEQRSAFLEARAPDLAWVGQGSDLIARAKFAMENDTLFDRFAGIFHAFACMEGAVKNALEADREREADSRLFGKKYDSLGNLLDRIETEGGDDVDRYIIVLCARQLCQEIARGYPEYWTAHVSDAAELNGRLAGFDVLRRRLIEKEGQSGAEFMDWFDRWFLKRAAPVESAAT